MLVHGARSLREIRQLVTRPLINVIDAISSRRWRRPVAKLWSFRAVGQASLLLLFVLFPLLQTNLKDRRWEWSLPGSVVATVLWTAFAHLPATRQLLTADLWWAECGRYAVALALRHRHNDSHWQ